MFLSSLNLAAIYQNLFSDAKLRIAILTIATFAAMC